jgi:formylglycine-generating enzyme required for sulfatase activity
VPMPMDLMIAIGKAALHLAGVGIAGDIAEIAREVWKLWNKGPAERLDEVAGVVRADDEEIGRAVDAVIAELAGDEPEPVRQSLAAALKLVPAQIRQSQRHPDDPTGRTLRPGLVLERPEDLIPFLTPILRNQQPRFRPGDRQFDWVLDEMLGMGGFGEVWKAHNEYVDSLAPVALKFCTDPQARNRLLRYEAKVCARVMVQGHHPGIVALQATYLNADPPCLQYEYIEGGDLGGLIQDWHREGQKPTPEQVARTVLQIAEPVAFAHRLDPPIVHRDLKPANILVQRFGGEIAFKITDFGIGGIATARAVQATRQVMSPSEFMTTAVRGYSTLLYASPEQLRGSAPDPRDDVHALGVIWFQMLTGDLTEDRPGVAGRREFLDQGMPPALLDLLESCFDYQRYRPADANVLVKRLTDLLEPKPEGAAVPDGVSKTPMTPPARPSEPSAAPHLMAEVQPAARVTNSLGAALVRIEPGTFTMGSNESDDEKPPHPVRITKPFYLGAHPVTQGQYQAVMGQNPSFFQGSDDLPVEGVSWLDAVRFCNELSEREERQPCYQINGEKVTIVAGNGYRLPTEAEWEYACRAGSTAKYPFGDNEADLGEYAWFGGNSDGKTHPVGLKQPNRWGLYDMLGNVWEWCQDGYDADFYKKSPPDDPPGPSEAPSRVIRGGGWNNGPWGCRPARRSRYTPGYRDDRLGFRLAAPG